VQVFDLRWLERTRTSSSRPPATPHSAVLSALIFNALIIPALIPLALRGVRLRPTSAEETFYRNLVVYGAGGLVVPFIGIKAIDLLLSTVV
jgi:potassium-transporting ATPase ATP-binding subunit